MAEKVAKLSVVSVGTKRFTYVLSEPYTYEFKGVVGSTSVVDIFTRYGRTQMVATNRDVILQPSGMENHGILLHQIGYHWGINLGLVQDLSNEGLKTCVDEFDRVYDWGIMKPFYEEMARRFPEVAKGNHD